METSVLDYNQLSEDYQRIEAVIAYLEQNVQSQPNLGEIAAHIGLSEYHFQRLFTRWVGISPKRFLQFLTKERAKQLLEASHDLLETAYAAGLSGPGRLHDLFVSTEAVTPGEYKRHGEGLEIVYGFHPSPFGECLLALTGRGICGLAFVVDGDRQAALSDLRDRWQKAVLHADPVVTGPYLRRIFSPYIVGSPEKLHLYLHGTNFQIKVWEALLRIPTGTVATYADVAAAIGMPAATRAVGNAVGRNPIPVIIPCHRVIRKVGDFGGYRYGTARKKSLLGWEAARAEALRDERREPGNLEAGTHEAIPWATAA
jgi:AraC family transcriptional regulator of adaptative response/methylated-DNA-[protein]-cysteine methyltransferase